MSGCSPRSSGRVAQAYHMVSRLPDPQQRFVLGSWRADERNRRRGVSELQNVLNDLPPPDPVFANPGAAPLADVDAARRVPGQTICGVPADEAIALTWDFGAARVSGDYEYLLRWPRSPAVRSCVPRRGGRTSCSLWTLPGSISRAMGFASHAVCGQGCSSCRRCQRDSGRAVRHRGNADELACENVPARLHVGS